MACFKDFLISVDIKVSDFWLAASSCGEIAQSWRWHSLGLNKATCAGKADDSVLFLWCCIPFLFNVIVHCGKFPL